MLLTILIIQTLWLASLKYKQSVREHQGAILFQNIAMARDISRSPRKGRN